MKTSIFANLVGFFLVTAGSSTSISQDGTSRTTLQECEQRWQLLKKEARDAIAPLRMPEHSIRVLARSYEKGRVEAISERQLPRRLVLVMGGLQCDTESSMSFAQALDRSLQLQNDVRLSVFGYPNDGSILESGEVLKKLLRELHASSPTTKVSVVTHSMGGLVARHALESACGKNEVPINQIVDQIAMICPPNHGSVLARYADALELGDAVSRMRKGNEAIVSIMQAMIDDGLGEACDELIPGSEFLSTLNKCDRAAGVKYTIYAGTRGPVSPLVRLVGAMAIGEGRSQLRSKEALAMDDILVRLDELVSSDELTAGLGDGAVSIRSARLNGVTDFVQVPMNHLEWTDYEKPHIRDLLNRLANKLIRPSP